MVTLFNNTNYSGLAQDIANAQGAPALLVLTSPERWYLPDPVMGNPLMLLVAAQMMVQRGKFDELRNSATELAAGRRTHINHFLQLYSREDHVFLARSYYPDNSPAASFLTMLLFDSLLLKLMAELTGLEIGGCTVFLPSTEPEALNLKGLPQPLPENVPESEGTVTDHGPLTPDLGPELPLLDAQDADGERFFADLANFTNNAKVLGGTRFVRRVLSPLRSYLQTRSVSDIERVKDPYVRESLLIHHNRLH
jgi:hypothetical protein